jgi:hypothetical protein
MMMHTTTPIRNKKDELFAPMPLTVTLGRVGHQQHTGGSGFTVNKKKFSRKNRKGQTRKAIAEY